MMSTDTISNATRGVRPSFYIFLGLVLMAYYGFLFTSYNSLFVGNWVYLQMVIGIVLLFVGTNLVFRGARKVARQEIAASKGIGSGSN